MLNEACETGTGSVKNIGGKKQCLEAPVKTYALAKDGFTFPDVTTAKTKAAWDAAIENKDIIPFPYVEGIEANNTDAAIRNGRYRDYTLKEAVRGSTYRQDLAICTHEAVKSFENSEYTRIFRITADDEVTCEVLDDGKVKGEALTSFIVGIRQEATDADVPFTNIQVKYKKELFSILKPSFDISELDGVYDVVLEQVSASATSIKFKAKTACSGNSISSLESADIVVKDDEGQAQTVSFVAPDSDGVYEVTGTAFATGYTVEIDGVVAKTDIFYEAIEPLTITVS